MSLAAYAIHPAESQGRRYMEAECLYRSPFQRDRDRILHSAAFRRLEYKTQVFVNHEGDHYRTRLTHSLEVAQIARSVCRVLALNEDLAEALALAHDLGHTPFGHAGEDGLKDVMKDYGGFDHNAQTLRVITRLEQRYAEFDGLNLTFETLEGIAKHNGPVTKAPRALAEYNALHNLQLHTYPGLEAQVAALADDIAYHNHDIDDGLRARLFTIADLQEVPAVGKVFESVSESYPGLPKSRLIHESVRRLINRMCGDLQAQTLKNIAYEGVRSSADVRALGRPLAAFSPEMEDINRSLKKFLTERMYRHYQVNRMSSRARRIVKALFWFFHNEPECLPTEWRHLAQAPGSEATAHVVADYIAGMTDRYAMREYHKLLEVDRA